MKPSNPAEEAFRATFEEHRNDQPILWHFTGPSVLYEILKPNGGLLASHAAYLNDISDLELLRKTLRLVGRHLEQTIPEIHKEKPAIGRSMENLAKLGILFSSFVCCFCTQIDSPLMWREYTRTGGFAIGFDKRQLLDSIQIPKHFSSFHADCDYDAWDEVLKSIRDLERKLDTNPISDDSLETDAMSQIMNLARKAATVKHAFFRQEHEFRLVFMNNCLPQKDEFVMLSGIPRICIPLKPGVAWSNLVVEIVVSPFGNQIQNYQTALLLADAYKIGFSRVKPYTAPVRSNPSTTTN